MAPFGLAGTLTGQSYKSQEATARLLEDWAQFYPLDNRNVANSDGGVVEVIVGGIKMRYPSCYVLVTDMDEEITTTTITNVPSSTTTVTTTTTTTNTTNSNNKNGNSMFLQLFSLCWCLFVCLFFFVATPLGIQTPPPSPVPINSRVPQPGPFSVSVEHPLSMQREPTAANVLPERVWQECVVGSNSNSVSQQQQQQECNWEFMDPLRRVGCTCSK